VTIENFIQERVYLKGVSPRTVEWYHGSFRAFKNALGSKQTIIARIAELKSRGASHITINSYLRCVNAYFRWLHVEHGRDAIRIPKLKEEQKILQTLSTEGIEKIMKFRPKATSRNLFRAHLIALTILDTGLRISEVLGLVVTDVDLDNLLLRVKGKGGKHRLVPFSYELRKILFRYIRAKTRLLFGTRNETQVSTVNIGRDIRVLGRRIGITGVRFSPHTLRHTFAVTFLRNGGDVYMLSRILGHSSITTTTVYLRSIGIEALATAHQKFSPLVGLQRSRVGR
jgi:integrase/recombinase XerD